MIADWKATAQKAVVAAAGLLAAHNVLKGVPAQVNELGFPYWLLTYEHGFIRRGLVGSLFQWLSAGFDVGAQRAMVLALHVALAFAVALGLLAWGLAAGARAPSPRARTLVLTGTLALFLSELSPTLSLTSGYLDVFIVGLSAYAAWLVQRGRIGIAGVVSAVGPLVHDAFIFLWLPVLLIATRRWLRAPSEARREIGLRTLPVLAPVATSLLTLAFHSPSAVKSAIAALPVEQGIKDTLALYQFGLSPLGAFAIMWNKFVDLPGQVLMTAAIFLPGAVVVAGCATAIDRDERRWRRAAFAAVVTLSPCAVLLIAWDLSRFLVWSTFAAFLLLVANALDGARPGSSKSDTASPVPFLALAVLAALSTGPHLYAYFEVASGYYALSPSSLRRTPAAKLAYAYLEAYNAKLFVDRFASRDRCGMLTNGNVQKMDPCAFLLQGPAHTDTEELWLPAGSYVASITTSPDDQCSGAGSGQIAPLFFWRFGGAKSETAFDASEPRATTVRFEVSREEAVMARVRVRVSTHDGCFRVEDVRVTPER